MIASPTPWAMRAPTLGAASVLRIGRRGCGGVFVGWTPWRAAASLRGLASVPVLLVLVLLVLVLPVLVLLVLVLLVMMSLMLPPAVVPRVPRFRLGRGA